MIPYKYTLFFLGLVMLCSCSSEYTEYSEGFIPKSKIQCVFNGTKSSVKTSSANSQLKGEAAPPYISGVNLTVENIEYTVDDIDRQYNVNDNMLEVVVLDDITVGKNKITAKGVCENSPLNSCHYGVPKMNNDDLNERAQMYADYLKQIHPIYVDYTVEEPVVTDISANAEDNIINLSMVPMSHRLAVVLENPVDSKYILKISVEKEDGSVLVNTQDFVETGSQVALVINDDSAIGDENYTVKVNYFTKITGTEMLDRTISKTLEVRQGANITKLYSFSKEELIESNSNTLFTWKHMEENHSGEYLQ